MNVGEFLRDSARRRREAGVWDCATFPADWVVANGRPDPMREWRGAYDTEAGALALIERSGDLAAMFSQGMAEAGVPTIAGGDDLQAGDIAVVRLLGEQAGAIYTGERWALVADRGLSFATLNRGCLVQIWRVPHG